MQTNSPTIHKLALDTIRESTKTPLLFYANATWAEASLYTLLQLISTYDSKSKLLSIAYMTQRGERDTVEQHLYGQHLIARSLIGEVVSSLAEVACQLGYLPISNEYKLSAIKKTTKRTFFLEDWSEERLKSQLGAPTFVVMAGATSTLCYGSNSDPWCYFDFVRYDSANLRLLAEPILRNVRFPSNKVRMIMART